MPGHGILHQINGVAGEFPDIVDLDDATASKTLEFSGKGIARVSVTAASTITLPDAGFMAIVIGNGDTGVVVDTAPSLAMAADDGEAGLAIRTGASTWAGVVLKPSAT